MEEKEINDFEYYAADDSYALIPDDEYFAECTEYKIQEYDGTKRKLYLRFQIFMDGDGGIETVYMPFNMPLNGRIGPRSKYYKSWRMANGKSPSRSAKLSPRVFKNKFYKIRTRTVNQYKDGKVRPEDKRYSVVDKILLVIKKPDKNTPTTHFDN